LGGLAFRLLPSIGTPEQIEKYYLPTIQGTKSGAFAMSEPDAGSDVLAMKTRAKRTNRGWRITGSKMYITGAPYSDYLVVVAYTDPEARARGVSLFIVDTKTPGIEIQKMDKLGHRSMETGLVFFDCEVPPEALFGAEGDGMRNVMSVLESGRLTHAARSLGVARACLELATEQAATRKTFGHTINQYQAIQFKLARMAIELRSAKLHVFDAAQRYDAGQKIHLEASMAKVVASEAAIHLADEAMQIFGGQGYIMDSPIQRFFRDARLYPISEGTTEIQLRNIGRETGIRH
jgi:alkylation response protein AidB-like acyl-CoA dehydrogenase